MTQKWISDEHKENDTAQFMGKLLAKQLKVALGNKGKSNHGIYMQNYKCTVLCEKKKKLDQKSERLRDAL